MNIEKGEEALKIPDLALAVQVATTCLFWVSYFLFDFMSSLIVAVSFLAFGVRIGWQLASKEDE